MKTIKIFLSSSSELENDICALARFVHQLNKKVYEKRDICLQLFQWESFETGNYSGNRYQDAYNDIIADCDIFIALFHKTAGAFTIAEYDNSIESFRKIGQPKVYIYFKTLKEDDIESESLRIFKERLSDLGCYPTYYHNIDALQLHFVMQLQLVESNHSEELKVEDGKVVLDGMPITRMENLPFAGQNEDFQRLSTRLAELPAKIEKARAKTEKYPDDEDFRDDFQALLNEYNKLKDESAECQNNLFATAKRIAQLQGESITDRMRRAMEAFNEGNVREANIILDEADDLLSTLEASREEVEASIEEIKFKIQCIQYDSSLSQDKQFTRVDSLYTKAIELSKEIDYDTDKFDKLLFDYAQFLYDNCYYEKAKEYFIQELKIRTTLLGIEHPDTATSYNSIGLAYSYLGEYDKGLEYIYKALAIFEKLLGSEHPIIATSYNKIGDVYKRLGCYDNALEYHIKALEISKKVLGLEDSSTATSYHNIGNVYSESGDYDKALEYYFRALDIQEKKLGIEHPDTASSYGNIGEVYYKLKQYDKAQEYYLKALDVYEKKFGSSHPTTVSYKKSISLIYDLQGKTKEAKYYFETIKAGPEWNVYISTCIEDYEKAKQYATAISNCGFQPIISVDGSVNSDEYRMFISLATETFYKSKACFKEYDEAYNAGKKIAVLQLDKFQADPRLTNVIEDWTDVGDYKTLEEEMAKLLARKTNQNVATVEQRQRNADADFERYEPQKNDTNIFISYRRKDGRNFARIVELALKLRGYKNVFMDYTSLKDGYFNNQILDSIYSCDDFIFITTDAACEAIKKGVSISEDWVAKEIRSAIRHNKHIIPLVIEEMFNNGWPKDEELSEDGKMVKSNQDRKLKDDEYFDDSIGMLEAFLHTNPSIVINGKASYKVKVNKKAYLYIDDEKIQTLEANTLAKIPLEQGGYFRRIEDAEDATNFVEDAIEMYKDKAEIIKLN